MGGGGFGRCREAAMAFLPRVVEIELRGGTGKRDAAPPAGPAGVLYPRMEFSRRDTQSQLLLLNCLGEQATHPVARIATAACGFLTHRPSLALLAGCF